MAELGYYLMGTVLALESQLHELRSPPNLKGNQASILVHWITSGSQNLEHPRSRPPTAKSQRMTTSLPCYGSVAALLR